MVLHSTVMDIWPSDKTRILCIYASKPSIFIVARGMEDLMKSSTGRWNLMQPFYLFINNDQKTNPSVLLLQ